MTMQPNQAPTAEPPDATTALPDPITRRPDACTPTPVVAPDAPGVVLGPNGEQGEILTEEQYLAQLGEEKHTLHIGVLAIGAALAMLISAVGAVADLGAVDLVGACVGTFVTLLFAIPMNTVVGWIVGKIFGEDFGSFPILLLRFGAVTAAFTAVMSAASLVMGPMIALVLVTPVMLLLAVWLIGMDFFQSLIFTAMVSMAQWLVAAFVMMSLASLLAFGDPAMDMDMMDMDMTEMVDPDDMEYW